MIIGLTGSIGSGKSEMSKIFKSFGAHIIDADKISRQITKTGNPILKEIVSVFGDEIITKCGALNRYRLANIVFENHRAKIKLEKILHPKIISQIRKESDKYSKTDLVIIDAPLLFESKLNKLCDKIIAITIKKDIQIKRLQNNRKMTQVQIENRINSQMSQENKAKMADFVIDNSGGKKDLKTKTLKIMQILEISVKNKSHR